jgi:hypothetical protein
MPRGPPAAIPGRRPGRAAAVQVRDPGGGIGHLSAQFWRLHDLGFGAQREDVQDGRVGRLDAHPGLRPVLPPRGQRAAAAEPQARRTAEHGGQAPAARGQEQPGPPDAARGRRRRAVPGAQQVAGEAVQQLEAAQPAAAGVDGNTGAAQGLDVTHDGARRHLELAGEFPGAHPAPGLEQAEQTDETAGAHTPRIIPIHDM